MAYDKKYLLGSTMIAGAAALALAGALPGSALAQTQTVPTQAQPTTPAPAPAPADQTEEEEEEAEDEGTEVEALVVTGSRIRRNEFTSAAPITVISNEESQLEGLVSTSDIVQTSTATGGSFQVNNQLTGFVTEGGPGVNTLSLRGLGAQRTLVLLNGRRAGPAGVRGQVGPFDLNVIPSAIVERIEILKSGASSIYGSDAIAGVANFITRTNLDGGEVSGFVSYPFEEGGEQYLLSGAYGRTFDRGYFNVAAEYFRQERLLRGQREGTRCASDYVFDPLTGQRMDYINTNPTEANLGGFKCYGLFAGVLRLPAAAGGDLIYARPGETYPTAAEGNNSPVAGMVRQGRAGFPETFPYANFQHPLYGRATTISPTERATIFSTFGYDIADNFELYGELLFSRRESAQEGVRQYFPSIAQTHPNNRRPDTGAPFGGSLLPIIPLPSDQMQEVNYARGVLGFRGSLPQGLGFLSGWDWDLYGQYSRSDGDYLINFIYNDRSYALGDISGIAGLPGAPTAPQRTSACTNTPVTNNQFNPGNVSGFNCSALPGGIPWTSQRILNGEFTPEERAFLFGAETGNTVYNHAFVEGSMTGELFNLPAGPISAAVGFQLRREEIDDTPGPQALLQNYWGFTLAGRTAGSDTVREVFGEVELPLLRDRPFVQDLTLTLSGRYSDYESYGASRTYQAGLNYQINPAFRIRATTGTSFRAPALYEQFLGNQTAFSGQAAIDPCVTYDDNPDPIVRANCASIGIPPDYTAPGSSSALVTTGGGKDILVPETSEARTLGVIWTPSFVDLSVAIDYFEIEVEDEIRTFGSFNIINQCFSSPNFPNSPFCTLFTRDPVTFNILTVNNSYVNVASQSNRGIDLTVRYGHEFSFGDLRLNGQFTWQIEDTTELLGGSEEDYLGTTFGYRGPDFVGNLNARFDRGDWTFTYAIDMQGKGSDTEQAGGDVFSFTRYADVSPGGIRTSSNCANGATSFCVYFKQYIEFTTFHSFSVQRVFNDWTFRAGIRNLYDERTPAQSTGQFRIGESAITSYNDGLIGRRGFINITRRF